MAETEYVILVDEKDNPLGIKEKMAAHQDGDLHRAFSIFVFNSKGELMLQQRSLNKYHSPGLWTNTCCSHPRENEAILEAAHRRLMEEMGFDCEMKEEFTFKYKANVGEGLTEHEFDHVFIGTFDGLPEVNKEEVNNWKFILMDDVLNDMEDDPDKFTIWFRIAFDEVERHFRINQLKHQNKQKD